MNVKPIVIRALKTFIQGALGSASFGILLTNAGTGDVAYRALIVGAFSAGVSALMNAYLQPTKG